MKAAISATVLPVFHKAIDTVTIFDNHPAISTISNKKPIGICGTGVIETVYELVKEKIVDNTGLIADKYFDNGYPLTENISFTNKDIREVQLAKSAIRAGIEILVTSYGIDYSQIAHLYLAGGFGQNQLYQSCRNRYVAQRTERPNHIRRKQLSRRRRHVSDEL